MVPKATYSRLARIEARLDALVDGAMDNWGERATAIMSDSELSAFVAHSRAQAETTDPLPVPAELQALMHRMMTDTTLAEARNRAQWLATGREWGRVWRELV